MKTSPKNVVELLANLKSISESSLVQETDRNFALALAYLVSGLVPPDRTTKRVFEGPAP